MDANPAQRALMATALRTYIRGNDVKASDLNKKVGDIADDGTLNDSYTGILPTNTQAVKTFEKLGLTSDFLKDMLGESLDYSEPDIARAFPEFMTQQRLSQMDSEQGNESKKSQ